MAYRISRATGNFTAAATWALVDATSLLDSELNNTALTTAYVASAASTPGAITVDAIAVKIFSRSGSPVGTMSVELFNSTAAASVAGTEVTIDVQDLANTGQTGWAVFKFAAPVVLLAATNYQIRAKTSSASMVNLYRNATAANWSRLLRTTTTGAPAAADTLIVAGEFLAAGSANAFVVTMNSTSSATTYGQIDLCRWASLAYGVAASTNYYLKIAGNFNIYSSNGFAMGTLADPIPSTSTAKLEFACGAVTQFGMVFKGGGSFTSYGNSITDSAELTADAAAAATSLTTGTSTGWKNGDSIALSCTTRTSSEAEKKSLTADAVGTTLTIAALASAHSGSGATKCKILNLTRNVSVFSISSTNTTFIVNTATDSMSCNNTEFYNMGSSSSGKRGIDVATTTGSFALNGCSLHDFAPSSAVGLNIAASFNNVTVTNCVFYDFNNNAVAASTTASTNITFNNLKAIKGSFAPLFSFASLKFTITNLYANAVLNSSGGQISLSDTTLSIFGTVSGLEACGSGSKGIVLTSITPTNLFEGRFTISNLTAWRNSAEGIQIATCRDMFINGVTAFGNGSSSSNVLFSPGQLDNVTVDSAVVDAGTTLTCPTGLVVGTAVANCRVNNSSFGATTTHSNADVNVNSTGYVDIQFSNCLFSSSTEITGQTAISSGSYGLSSDKHDQVTGAYKLLGKFGTATLDTTISRTASPSLRMTPNTANYRYASVSKFVAVPSGQAASVSFYVRESVAGDGTKYNGSPVRLIVKQNIVAGIASDTVLATATGASVGAWELLAGTSAVVSADTVLEFYIDCGHTSSPTGWVNVDDVSTTSTTDVSGLKFWTRGWPTTSGGAASSGGSFTFS